MYLEAVQRLAHIDHVDHVSNVKMISILAWLWRMNISVDRMESNFQSRKLGQRSRQAAEDLSRPRYGLRW